MPLTDFIVGRNPRVQFTVRYPAGSATWRYETVMISSFTGGGHVPMEHLPAVGDLITLWDSERHRRGEGQLEGGPCFRVITRLWYPVGYGSVVWPYGQAEPSEGPMVDIITEPAGRFAAYPDEAPICGQDGCWARLLFGVWTPRPGYDDDDLPAHDHYPRPDPQDAP